MLITELGSHVVNAGIYLHSLHRPRVRAAGAVCNPARTGRPWLEGWERPWPPVGPGALHASPALLGVLGHLVQAAGEEWHPHVPCGEQKGMITLAPTTRGDVRVLPHFKGSHVFTTI